MASDAVRINGNIVSWGSIKVKAGGETFYGFTSLSYGDKRTRTKAYGMGKHHAPRGRSRGKYEADPVKLGGPKSTIHQLRENLAALSSDGISYGDVEIQIVAEYIEANEPPMIVELEDCVWMSNASNEEENPDPLSEEIELDTMKIRRNGKVLFDASEGAP